jgi:hypothetical protein
MPQLKAKVKRQKAKGGEVAFACPLIFAFFLLPFSFSYPLAFTAGARLN